MLWWSAEPLLSLCLLFAPSGVFFFFFSRRSDSRSLRRARQARQRCRVRVCLVGRAARCLCINPQRHFDEVSNYNPGGVDVTGAQSHQLASNSPGPTRICSSRSCRQDYATMSRHEWAARHDKKTTSINS